MTTALSNSSQAYLSQAASSQAVPSVRTLAELLDYRAEHQPQQLAYQYLHRGETVAVQLTYGVLRDRTQSIAAHLQARKLSGGRALLLFSPGLEFVAAFLGCLKAGVTAVPVYPPRKNRKMLRLQAIVKDADAAVILTTAALFEKIGKWASESSLLAGVQWLAIDTLGASANTELGFSSDIDFSSDTVQQSFTTGYQANPQSNPLAFLQYTSGSTGNPKGVMVSQENLMHNLGAIYRSFGHSPDSKGVIWLPPYHDMGLIGGILQPLYGGFPVSLISPVDFLQKPLRWLKAISQHKATTSGGPDFAYALCARKAQALLAKEQEGCHGTNGASELADLDLSSWTVAFTGAEPIRAETLNLFTQVFEPYGFRPEAFYPCYGMAETTLIASGGQISTAPMLKTINAEALVQHQVQVVEETVTQGKEHHKMASRRRREREKESILPHQVQTVVSCGKSLPDQTIEIVHPETRLRCSPNSVGEIWISGRSVALGYWNNPQETQKTYDARIADTGEGPFLRTGDLGFFLNGELFVTGRLKDMMIIRGQNYYPQDIERTVETAHPAIRTGAIAAFSIEAKGKEQLVIVSEVERTHIRQLDVDAVVGCIRQAIAAQHNLQMHAAMLVKTGSIPKTSSGKIQRYRCKQLFSTGELCIVKDWSENPQHKSEFLKLQAEMNSVLDDVNQRSKNIV